VMKFFFGLKTSRSSLAEERPFLKRSPMEPIIDLQSDAYFMGEALRMAVRAYEAEEVPIGAVVVREG
jgi:hypothetical protein